MIVPIRRDIPLLGFLNLCNNSGLEKKVLDCGAGGSIPPLAIFYRAGYQTFGIEISENQITNAEQYSQEHDMDFNIIKGDMRNLPYENESFSFVFSHHTIHHMKKTDIQQSIREMIRVLKPEGLLFVNLPSIERRDFGRGQEVGKGEFVNDHNGIDSFHSYFEDDEADSYFEGCEIIHKIKWNLIISEEWADGLVMLEYVARKTT